MSRRSRIPPPRAARPLPAPRDPAPVRGASLVAAALAFVVYLAMTPNASGDKDGSEFTLVLATLGAAHPTGYALYTLVGHAFAQLAHALGASWPFAANAFSGLGGAVAVGLLHALAARLLRAGGTAPRAAAWLAALPALAFGMNPIWTMETTLAEVNSWHVAWVAGLALYTLWAEAALARREGAASPARVAALAGWIIGAGLAHHLTSVWFSLPFGVLLFASLRRQRSWSAAVLASGLAGLALGVSSVAYVFWRATHPALEQWPVLDASTAWDHVLGAQYRGYLGHFAPSEIQRRFLAAYVYPWLAPSLLALLALPFARTSRVPRGWRAALATGAGLQTVYVFLYGVPDPSSYFLPVLALGLAVWPAWITGASALVRREGRWIAGSAAAILVVVSTMWFRTGYERARTYESFDELVHRMWLSVPFEDGFVIWGDDMVHRLREYQLLRREKPRVTVLNPAQLTYRGPHDAFVGSEGFDPLAGLPPLPPPVDEPSTLALYEAITERINAASPKPVVWFDPAGPTVRLLKKPGESGPAQR